MRRLWSVLRPLGYPPLPLLVPLICGSAAALAAVFTGGLEFTAFAYAAYTASAYTLLAVVLRAIRLVRWGRGQLHQRPLLHRYLTELDFKAEVSLHVTFGLNLLYAVYNAAAGIFYHSVWFGTMAFYYTLLSTERFLLVRDIRKRRRDPLQELKRYRFCGGLLLILTVAIIGMGIFTIYGEKTVFYPGNVIYAAAAYTFFSLVVAIVNLVRYQRLKNPIYAASKAVALATALVAIFFLQVAMFTAFGDGGAWQTRMNLWTGLGVLTAVTGMALYMLIHGSREIQRLSKENT